MDFRELFRDVRRRPGMFLAGGANLDYRSAVAFVAGVDEGANRQALDGFRPYLVLRLDDGDDLAWSELVLQLTLPPGFARPLSPDDDRAAVDGLFDLLDEFLTEVGHHGGGRQAIFREHQAWLQSRPWFNAELQRFGSSPAGPVLTVAEAASHCGVDQSTLLELVYAGKLRAGRVGAQLMLRVADIERVVEPL